MVAWVAMRHVAYMIVCYSIYAHLPVVIDFGCYEGKNGSLTGPFPPPNRFAHLLDPFRNPEGVVCFNDGINWGFLGALLFLQGIQVMWFGMILRVAVSVLRGGKADDTRSDDEGDEDDEVEEKIIRTIEELDDLPTPPPYEEEVGVEAINFKGRRTSNASRYRKSSGGGTTSTSHSIDRKELLGRIGCDKGV